MTWRSFDLESLPPVGARMRLARDAGMLTGIEARFLYVADNIRDLRADLPGPWVIGYRTDRIARPLVYLPAAWEWFDAPPPPVLRIVKVEER